MGTLLANVLLAGIPAIVLVAYFYRRDSLRREPVPLIWKTFLWGFFSVIPAALAELFATRLIAPTSILFDSFVVAGLVEEMSKFLVVRIFIYRRPEFDEVSDGMVYTITAGLGFAFFENILYSGTSVGVLVLRGLTAVPLHAVSAGIMGYYIGRSKFGGKPVFTRGIAYAVLVHGAYDYVLLSEGWPSLLVVPLLIGGFGVLSHLWRKAQEADRLEGRA
jgi:protease PrsW